MRTCNTCNIEKSVESFTADKRLKVGVRAVCKECHSAYYKKYNKDNKVEANKKSREYYNKHKDRLAVLKKDYTKDNLAHFNSYNALRRANKIKATPSWADHDAVKRLYIVSRFMKDKLGENYHVDHMIPLNGENICGLHCETNLQLMPALENMSKGNSFN